MIDPELGFFVRPDSLDFRDRIFQPTLIEVPSEIPLSAYRQVNVPVLNQLGTGVATRAGVRSTTCAGARPTTDRTRRRGRVLASRWPPSSITSSESARSILITRS